MSVEQRLLQRIERAGGTMKVDDALRDFASEEQAVAELSVYRAIRSGRLDLRRDGTTPLLVSRPPASSAPAIGESGAAQEASDATPVSLVATVPVSLQAQLKRSGIALEFTDDAFERLLDSAKRYVKLSLPFPEEAGIARYAHEIRAAAQRGVRFFVLSRQLRGSYSRDYGYASLLKSMLRFRDLVEANGGPGKFLLRDFHESICGNAGQMHYESTHAKIVLRDGEEAYIGSGEFRVNALLNNFELGFVTRGRLAKEAEELFDLVWSNGTAIGGSKLQSLARQPEAKR